MPPSAADPLLELLQAKGLEHERRHLESLRVAGKSIVEIEALGSLVDRVEKTRAAMAAGVDVIYQGALFDGRWSGYADFLVKVPGSSILGSHLYEPVDTKLALTAKPRHALQLAVYSALLAKEQGVAPPAMHIVLGDNEVETVRVADIHHYVDAARQRLEDFVRAAPASSESEPCSHCAQCRWSARCEAEWMERDDLSLVANITGRQREKLNEAGISTVAALATWTPQSRIPGLRPALVQRLAAQARLQLARRGDGKHRVEPLNPSDGKGFARLPEPDRGDLFFDMEGDPLVSGGLEYLFGFLQGMEGGEVFVPFWGHTRAEERRAFEQAVDFMTAQLEAFPEAHVYHYASYEENALKRLAMLHGTREADVDDLLRAGKLVDLYQVVREAIWCRSPNIRSRISNRSTCRREAVRSSPPIPASWSTSDGDC